jgi:hypothetical protein
MVIETAEPVFSPVSPPTRSVELLAWFGAQFDVAPPNRCAQAERVATFLADVDVSALWVLAHHSLLRRGDVRTRGTSRRRPFYVTHGFARGPQNEARLNSAS